MHIIRKDFVRGFLYIIQQEEESGGLMAVLPAFRMKLPNTKAHIIIRGIRLVLLANPVALDAPINSESDDFSLIANPDMGEGYFSSDLLFWKDSYSLARCGYPLLIQILSLMNKYPTIILEVAAHTDNIGTSTQNLALSQMYAVSMTNYLIEKGIDRNRLVARGYGESRPIVLNFLEKQRILNRRIELNIIEE